jgi:hypothetical protein
LVVAGGDVLEGFNEIEDERLDVVVRRDGRRSNGRRRDIARNRQRSFTTFVGHLQAFKRGKKHRRVQSESMDRIDERIDKGGVVRVALDLGNLTLFDAAGFRDVGLGEAFLSVSL